MALFNSPLKTIKVVPQTFPQKKQKIMNVLKEADINQEGDFNEEELKDLGSFFPAWRAKRAFQKFDANNDGQISGQEIDSLLECLHSSGFGK